MRARHTQLPQLVAVVGTTIPFHKQTTVLQESALRHTGMWMNAEKAHAHASSFDAVYNLERTCLLSVASPFPTEPRDASHLHTNLIEFLCQSLSHMHGCCRYCGRHRRRGCARCAVPRCPTRATRNTPLTTRSWTPSLPAVRPQAPDGLPPLQRICACASCMSVAHACQSLRWLLASVYYVCFQTTSARHRSAV